MFRPIPGRGVLPRRPARLRRRPAPVWDPSKGWGGLDDLWTALTDAPITEMQFGRMAEGFFPGQERGRFGGLNAPALQLISKMLKKNEPSLIDTSQLSGDDLFRAELQNQVAKMTPVTYSINPAVNQEFFTDLLDDMPGAFRKGYDPMRPFIPRPPVRKRRRRGQTPPIVPPPYHLY